MLVMCAGDVLYNGGVVVVLRLSSGHDLEFGRHRLRALHRGKLDHAAREQRVYMQGGLLRRWDIEL